MKKLYLGVRGVFGLFCFYCGAVYAQSTGINNNSPNPKAALDVASKAYQGFLMPRMAVADTGLIGAAKGKDIGLMFFDNTNMEIKYWDGTRWRGPRATGVSVGVANNVPFWSGGELSAASALQADANSVGIGGGLDKNVRLDVKDNSLGQGIHVKQNGGGVALYAEANAAKSIAVYGDGGTSGIAAVFKGGPVGIGTATPTNGALLDVNGPFKLGAAGTPMAEIIRATISTTTPVLPGNGSGSYEYSLPGAQLGSTVLVSPNKNIDVIIGYAFVHVAGRITIKYFNANPGLTFGTDVELYVTVIR